MALRHLLMYTLYITTLRTPADISLPMHRPFVFDLKMQSRTTIFSVGCPMRQPSWSRPAFMATPSSPVVKSQFWISTLVHDSGSQPSLFRFMLLMVTCCTVTLLHSTGCITQ